MRNPGSEAVLLEHRLFEFRLYLGGVQARKDLEPGHNVAFRLWEARFGRAKGLKVQQLPLEHKRLALRTHRHTGVINFQQPHFHVHLFGCVIGLHDQVCDEVLRPVIKLHIKVPASGHVAVEASATRWRGQVFPNDTAGTTRKVGCSQLGTIAIAVSVGVAVATSAVRRGTPSLIGWGGGSRPALAPPLASAGGQHWGRSATWHRGPARSAAGGAGQRERRGNGSGRGHRRCRCRVRPASSAALTNALAVGNPPAGLRPAPRGRH